MVLGFDSGSCFFGGLSFRFVIRVQMISELDSGLQGTPVHCTRSDLHVEWCSLVGYHALFHERAGPYMVLCEV